MRAHSTAEAAMALVLLTLAGAFFGLVVALAFGASA